MKSTKSFGISKHVVMEAYRRVKANRGARISAIPLTSDWPDNVGGFVDTATRHHLMLAYFDRPCHLWAQAVGRDERGAVQHYDVDVTIRSPGIVWLESVPTANAHYVEVEHALTSAAPTFLVWLR